MNPPAFAGNLPSAVAYADENDSYAENFRSRFRQFTILGRQKLRQLYRQWFQTAFILLCPMLLLLPLLSLRAQVSNRNERAACHYKPVALPTAGAARVMQSLVCGLDVACYPEDAVQEENPSIFFERSLIPRWWQEVYDNVFGKSEPTEQVTLALKLLLQLWLDAPAFWIDNADVREYVLNYWLPRVVQDAKTKFGVNLNKNVLPSASSDEPPTADQQMADVLRTLAAVFSAIDNPTRPTSSDGKPLWDTTLNLLELYFAVAEPGSDNFDSRTKFRAFIDGTVLFGLSSNSPDEPHLIKRKKLQEYLKARSRADAGLSAVFLSTGRMVREMQIRSQQIAAGLGNNSANSAVYRSLLLNNAVCGHKLIFPNNTVNNADNNNTSPAPAPLAAWQQALSETRLDSSVLKMLLDMLNTKTTSGFMDTSLLRLETLLGNALNTSTYRTENFTSLFGTPKMCFAFENEVKRVLKTNVFYSLLKPLLRGKLLYYVDASQTGALHSAETIDAIVANANRLLAPIRRSLSYMLQTLNLFTNIGYARSELISSRNSRLLARIVQKIMTSSGAGAKESMTLESLCSKVTAFLSEKNLREDVLKLVSAALDVQHSLFSLCIPFADDNFVERAPSSIAEFDRRAAQLDASNSLLAGIVFAPDEVYRPANGYADYFRTTSGLSEVRSKTITYELQMNRKRMRELDRIEPKLHSMEAAMPPLHYLRYLMTFVPVQDALDRSIMVKLAHERTSEISTLDDDSFPALYAQKMPVPCFLHDDALKLMIVFLPLLVIVGVTLNAGLMAYDLACDREENVDRMLRLHGLASGVRTCVWLVKWVVLWTLTAIVMVIFEYWITELLEKTDWTLHFLMLWTFFMCNLAFTFFVTSLLRLFGTPPLVTSAVVMGALLIFSVFPARWLGETELRQPDWVLILFWLIHCANGFVLFVVTMIAEQGRTGLQWYNWGNVGQLYGAVSPREMYYILAIDCVLYGLLGLICSGIAEWQRRREEKWPLASGLDTNQNDDDDFDGERLRDKLTNAKAAVALHNVSKNYYGSSRGNWWLPRWLKRSGLPSTISSEEAVAASMSIDSIQQQRKNSLALRNVSANFVCNEIVCLLGLNGAGKSTLMSILCGFAPPSRGVVRMFGRSLTSANIDKCKRFVGYCPQQDVILRSTTVREHLELYAQLRHCVFGGAAANHFQRNLNEMIDDVLRRTDLMPFANVYAEKLSGGYKRRLMLAIAFACGTRICVLDEPTSGVDPAARRLLWQLILQQRRTDRVVVVSSHHVDEAQYLADRVAIVNKGVIAAFDTPQALIATENLSNITALDMNITKEGPLDWHIRLQIDTTQSLPAGLLITRYSRSVELLQFIRKQFSTAMPTIPVDLQDGDNDDLRAPGEDNEQWLSFTISEPYSAARKLQLISSILAQRNEQGPLRILDVEVVPPHLGQIFCSVIGAPTGEVTSSMSAENTAELQQQQQTKKPDTDSGHSTLPDSMDIYTVENLAAALPTATTKPAKDPHMTVLMPFNATAGDDVEIMPPKCNVDPQTFASRAIIAIGKCPGHVLRQFLAIIWKRAVHDVRNPLMTVSIYALSTILLIITALFLNSVVEPPILANEIDGSSGNSTEWNDATYLLLHKKPIELAEITHTSRDHIDLNPNNHYWAFPTFYAYNASDQFANEVVHMLKYTRDLNHMDENKCFRCPDAYNREGSRIQKQLDVLTQNSTSIKWRMDPLTEKFCGYDEHLALPPPINNATSFMVDPQTNIKLLHVDLSVFPDIVEQSSEAAVYIRPRHTQIRKIFGGYSFRRAQKTSANNNNKSTIIIWHSPHAEHALPKFLSKINSALLKVFANDERWYLNAYASALLPSAATDHSQAAHVDADDESAESKKSDEPFESKKSVSRLSNMAFIILTLTFTFLPTYAAVYLINERERGERRAQMLSGLSPLTYWLSTLVYDLVLRQYILFLPVAAIVFAALPSPVYSFEDGSYWCCMILIIVFCFSSTTVVYCASHMYRDPQLAFTTLGSTMVMVGFTAALVANPADFLSLLDGEHGKQIQVNRDWLFLWLPHYLLAQSLMNMQQSKLRAELLSEFICREIQGDGSEEGGAATASPDDGQQEAWHRKCASAFEEDVWDWNITGRCLVSMIISGVSFFALLLIMEWLIRPNLARIMGTRRMVKATSRNSTSVIGLQHVSYSYAWWKKLIRTLFCCCYWRQIPLADAEMQPKLTGYAEQLKREREIETAVPTSKACRWWWPFCRANTKNAVDNVSLQVRTGECYGLFGFNGAGKTTLFKCLTGQLTPQAGVVTLYEDVNVDDGKKRQRPLIGYCPQTDPLEPYCTLYETLAYHCVIRNMQFTRHEARRIEQRFGFSLQRAGDWDRQQVGQLSGGTRRKLSTAIAMLRRPRLLLLDEPTTGVDVTARTIIGAAVRACMRKSDCAVILTSHHMSDARSMCSRLAIVRRGRLVLEDDMQQVEKAFSRRYLVLTVCLKPLVVNDGTKSADLEEFSKHLVNQLNTWLSGFSVNSVNNAAKLPDNIQIRRLSPRLIDLVINIGGDAGDALRQQVSCLSLCEMMVNERSAINGAAEYGVIIEDFNVQRSTVEEVFSSFSE